MANHTYKNITDQELVVIGHGVVAPGGTIESDEPIENQNLVEADKPSKSKSQERREAATEDKA